MTAENFAGDNRMKTSIGLTLLAGLVIVISGCASTVTEIREYRSYGLGQQATASKGNAMLVREEGTVEKKRRWVGVLNSPDGWQVMATNYSDDFVRKELIYEGGTGSKIKVAYREFSAGSTIPKNQQKLTFDLSESSVIEVRDFRLKILKIDENSVNYIVVKD